MQTFCFTQRVKKLSVKIITCRDGPAKAVEQGRDENTRKLPSNINMVERKTRRLLYICNMTHLMLFRRYLLDLVNWRVSSARGRGCCSQVTCRNHVA